MKKLFTIFALVVAVSLTSCSDDDGPNNPTTQDNVSARINGVDYVFNNVEVETEQLTAPDGHQYTDVRMTATIDGSTNRWIFIGAEQGVIGNAAVWGFDYLAGNSFYNKNNNFTIEVQESTTNRIKGTFSGEVQEVTSGEILNITNGTFDVAY